jgi:hypothetical protein
VRRRLPARVRALVRPVGDLALLLLQLLLQPVELSVARIPDRLRVPVEPRIVPVPAAAAAAAAALLPLPRPALVADHIGVRTTAECGA